MKIAFVRTASNILKYGGYNIQEIGLAKALLKYNVSTDVYARFSNVDEVTEICRESNNRVVIHPLKGKQIYKEIMYYPSLKDDLLSGGYDMVQLLDDSQMMLPRLFKVLKKSGVKTILWQGMYRDFAGKIAHTMQIIYDKIYASSLNRNSDLKIAKTEAAKKYLEDKHYTNIKVLPVGLDEVTSEVNSSFETQIKQFKSKYPNLLLYIGAIEPRRNPEFLVELMEQHNEWGLVMIGKGVSLESTKQLILQKGIQNQILMFDSVPNKNLVSVYNEANVFLLPTSYEIYGMVVMEALAFGKPVISTPEAGPQYLLSEKKYGVCEELDIEKWSSHICYYLSNYNSEVDRQSRIDYVNCNYRWPKIAEQYFKIISDLCNNKCVSC